MNREELSKKSREFVDKELSTNDRLQLNIVSGQISFKLKNSDLSDLKLDLINQYLDQVRYFYKNSPYKENLAKALGIKAGGKAKILDATLGMGKDAILLLAMGAEVYSFERNPWIYLLHLNYRELFENDSRIPWSLWKINYGQLDDEQAYQKTVYFDPMYQEVNNKAAPKKNMRIFREAFASDHDAEDFAKNLLASKPKRLVIKRPRKAELLLENPSHQILGKSTRYDIYLSL